MAGPGRPPKNRDTVLADLQEQTRRAAQADAENDEAPPDTVEVGGVTYYRKPQAPAAAVFDADPEYENVLIDIAPYASYILIDGRRFVAGGVYPVPRDEARNLRSIMASTWQHEKSTGGAFSNLPSSRNLRMSMATGTSMSSLGAPGVMPNIASKIG